MLNPLSLPNGREQYENFKSSATKKTYVQYDYRHTDGKLFTCIKPTLKACRQAVEAWLTKKETKKEAN